MNLSIDFSIDEVRAFTNQSLLKLPTSEHGHQLFSTWSTWVFEGRFRAKPLQTIRRISTQWQICLQDKFCISAFAVVASQKKLQWLTMINMYFSATALCVCCGCTRSLLGLAGLDASLGWSGVCLSDPIPEARLPIKTFLLLGACPSHGEGRTTKGQTESLCLELAHCCSCPYHWSASATASPKVTRVGGAAYSSSCRSGKARGIVKR